MRKFLLAAILLFGLTQAAHATKTQDTFVDAGAPICLVSHTPTTSGSWTHKAGTTCSSGTSGVAINVSGTLKSFVTNNTAIWAAATSTNDQTITVTLSNGTASNSRLVLRGTTAGSSQTGIVFGSSGGVSTVGDMHSGTYNAGFATATISFTTGDTIQFIVSGNNVSTKKNGTIVSGLNFTTVDFTSGTNLGLLARVNGDLYTSWVSDDFASNELTLNSPAALNGQILPPANGVTTASTVTFGGTYVGRTPSNVDVQLYLTDGTTVDTAWTALTGTSISGGIWSGTLSVPFGLRLLKAQARETDSTGVTSAVSTNTFGVGPAPLLIGQSNIANFWHFSCETTLGTTTSGSATAGLPNASPQHPPTFPLGSWLTGQAITGPAIPGGTTITGSYNTSGNPETFAMSANATATATGTATLNVSCVPPTPDALAFRYIDENVYGVGTGKQGSEAQIDTQANAEGAITLANLLSEQFGSPSMLLEQAAGGTSIAQWSSPSGSEYGATKTRVDRLGYGFDRVYWNQGENDAWNAVSTATYLAGMQNVAAWVRLYRANVPIFVTLLGTDPGAGATDADWEAIRVAQCQFLATDGNAFFGGGEIDLPHSGDVHLAPAGRISLARRMVAATLKQAGLAATGYGPQIDKPHVYWDGGLNVYVPVIQEGSATLTCAGGSTSCPAITGFRVFSNGSLATISSTALIQPRTIKLTLSTKPTPPITMDYQYGIQPNITSMVYDDFFPFGDANGLPLWPSCAGAGGISVLVPSGFIQGAPG